MDHIPIPILVGTLFILLCCSAFFSGSETGLMTLNRYRLKHLAKSNHKGAQRAQRMLERPDRLLSALLVGNNLVNISASSIATIIGLRLGGDTGLALATGLLTFVLLIFGEVIPKTYGALHPERVAFPASLLMLPFMKLMLPLVWLLNVICNGLLKLVGVDAQAQSGDTLSREELRTIVNEAGSTISRHHRSMLMGILDLEDVTVDDIMVPKPEVAGIDIEDDLEDIVAQLRASQHTRLVVYRNNINNPVGVLHLKRISRLLMQDKIDKSSILQYVVEPYYVPEGTPLHKQLIQFQQGRRRLGFVVDEYGNMLGIVTLEDILEEIVGEFTTDANAQAHDVQPQSDGSFIVDGGAMMRDLNRQMKWSLPTDGPRTLNGLIVERLETIPEGNTCIKVGKYIIETMEVKDNLVKTARILPISKKALKTAAKDKH
ncbi:Putative Mg2+ and Co2+ transporter CorB [gamma proteobacterium HdN1]|nr:Putative Mg2+ and Co2+ transporter CorB [gamma proteobacterium HdN1]